MNIESYRKRFKETLAHLYEPEEVSSLCFLTFEHVLKMNRVEVSLSRNMELSKQDVDALDKVLHSLEKSIPIQYILGKTEFYGLEFQVNPATLIPRPETEELVDWIIRDVNNNQASQKKSASTIERSLSDTKSLKILDVGTGSGCIAITLSKNLTAVNVEAIDVSQNALAMASQNAQRHQEPVTFYDQNILEVEVLEAYDIIVSNPPYVRMQEKAMMKDNVLLNEPESALYVSNDDPLLFYRKIGTLAYKSLSEDGAVYFEINEYLGLETVALLERIGFGKVTLRKDLFGKDRMIKAER